MTKLANISEVAKILNLVHPETKKPLNHILRYWEKEFHQIKPKKINDRRYYTIKDIELIKRIKFLLKDSKMTIAGVKNVLSSNIKKLDDSVSHGLRKEYKKKLLHEKSKKLLANLKKLKEYGKKNSS